ncbi:MAG: PEGA domain-containing protein [Phycisphaerales bacterium]
MTSSFFVKSLLIALALKLTILGSGCATLLNSETQPVTFNSDPEGALVRIDGVAYGRTPVTIPVQRKGWDKQVLMSLDGYKTEMFTLNNTLSGTTFLNVLWWPGAIVDGISGRGGKYESNVSIVMEPGEGTIDRDAMREEAEAEDAANDE